MTDTIPDRYHGVGGSYVIDPATGERRRVHEPTLPNDAPPGPAASEPLDDGAPGGAADPKPRARKGA